PNPSELLGSEAFSDLLARARNSFDVVIVDTPPLLAVTDPALVGSITDGLLLIVRALATDRNALAMAASELRRMEIPVLGVIMNDIPLGRSFLGYGGYYGHYYGHYYASYAAHKEEPEPKGLGAGRS
ncbi:MAG: capsular biosynthesis protein, partial [Gemmatimonadota bacterium]|nr:capsular biosynthesis protein [Gemmatimonadota bacterium]